MRWWRRKRRGDEIAGESPPAAYRDVRRGDLLAVYGELLSAPDLRQGPQLESHCRLVGSCWIPGVLLDLGKYPGLVFGEGQVLGELWEIGDPTLFEELDEFEGYDPDREDDSQYVRRRMELIEPAGTAWVYAYSGSGEGHQRVESGDWRGHLADRFRLR
jgi:gamma-glutamylcyclotransferase (GGCT)/AIG2-like uncharacterized protein YtfP